MTTDIRDELRQIRERAEAHDMPDPCAPGDECECCTTARDNKRTVEALEAVVGLIAPQWRSIDYDRNALIDDLREAITEALTTKEADRG